MTVSRQIDERRARRAIGPGGPGLEAARPRVGTLAAKAIDVLVSRRSTCAGRSTRAERWITLLQDAVVGPDPGAYREVAARMLDSGMQVAELCDVYVPVVARRLGEEWCEDTMSFAEVSIGSARLQALLRDVALDPARDPADESRTGRVMVLADEHHTLGAMVLTGQLRRRGVSVRLVFDRSRMGLSQLAEGGGFDAVLLSVALAADLGAVRRLVTMLREVGGGGTPIVVGGGILDIGADRTREETGADLATSDPEYVLKLIGGAEQTRRAR